MKEKILNFFVFIKNKFTQKKEKKINKKRLEQFQNLDKKLVFKLSKKSKFNIPSFKQLKHLKKILSKKESFLIKILVFIIIINISFIGIFNYFQKSTYIPTEGGEYIEALIGNPKYINPILSSTNNVDNDLSKLIYSGLLKYDSNLKLVTDIAAAYEISDDQKEYTLHLKNNVYFHDNEELNADDVIFTIHTIQNPIYNSPLHINFTGVFVEKIDDYTVKFTLNEPYAPFLNVLTVGILPEHIWNNVPPSYFTLAEYNIKPIGSGSFKFEALTKDKSGAIKSITLENFDKYHNFKPLIKNIVFKFYPDFDTAVDALINKNVQGISKLPRKNYESVAKSDKYTLHQLQLPQYTALFFNLSKNNQWKEKEMRSILSYGFNKEKLIEKQFSFHAKKIEGPVLSGSIGYDENTKNPYPYNKEKAIELLEKNKWQLTEENQIRHKDGKPLSVTITTVDQFDNNDIAEFLKQEWEKIGIEVKLELIPYTEIKQKIKQRNYEILLYGQLIGSDPDPYPFWHSTQRVDPGLNLSMYANKTIDELIESARQTSNIEKRAEKYNEFNKIIMEDIPAIFIYSPLYIYTIDKKINNFKTNRIVSPSDRFNNIEQWYIKTKHTWK